MIRDWIARRWNVLRPLAGILSGLIVAACVMRLTGFQPLAAYAALWSGASGLEYGAASGEGQIALGSGHLNTFLLAQSLSAVTPLIFTGLAVAVGLRAGLFNVGAQGQMTMGALAAAAVGVIGRTGLSDAGTLNPALHVGLVLVAGAAAGAIWGIVPGILKAARGVHEVISTIMLNFIALDAVQYLVTHSLKDDAPGNQAAQSPIMASTSWLWPYVNGSNLTAGLPIALALLLIVSFMIKRTSLGYQIRAVGLGADAAGANGVPVARVLVTSMAISGAISGIAGAVQVMGIHHRYVAGVAGSFGFDGIAVALLGNLSGIGVLLGAVFFGALASGALYMQTNTNVPAPVSEIVQAAVIIFTGAKYTIAARTKNITTAKDDQDPGIVEGRTLAEGAAG